MKILLVSKCAQSRKSQRYVQFINLFRVTDASVLYLFAKRKKIHLFTNFLLLNWTWFIY
jgi:hypothetical protein